MFNPNKLTKREREFEAIVIDCVERLGYCPGPTELNQRMGYRSSNDLHGNYSLIRAAILERNGWVKNSKDRWVKDG